MNYIGLLTKEEKSTLCEIITGKEFKELFKRNEQAFTKVQKGFRAKSLTEQHALSIAITNIENPFIATWVNMRVEHWLKEIKENIAKLEGEGLSHGAALATTMLDSFFVNNVELYFKLTGAPLDTDVLIFTREWKILNLSTQEMSKHPIESGLWKKKINACQIKLRSPNIALMP